MSNLKQYITTTTDFPKPGIVFKDITPMLADAKAFDEVIETLAAHYRGRGVTHFAGIESKDIPINPVTCYFRVSCACRLWGA